MGRQLTLDLQGQENLIIGQAQLAYKNLLAARQRIRSFQDEAMPEASAMADIAKHGYELGQTDLNTLLDAQRTNIQTQTQYLDAVLTYQLAINDLEQSIGVPL
jgi:cobalt-zinc-cadmium efflux system outer membrane protein